jgi:hypothetical protein
LLLVGLGAGALLGFCVAFLAGSGILTDGAGGGGSLLGSVRGGGGSLLGAGGGGAMVGGGSGGGSGGGNGTGTGTSLEEDDVFSPDCESAVTGAASA